MSKAVLISIQPKWCELIASGKKTIEVRKTKPKLETPFKCYIYETRAKTDRPTMLDFGVLDYHGRGKVIGEFVCDTYVVDKTYGHDPLFNGAACMSEVDAAWYCVNKEMYGWHISDLVIYDEPKRISYFCLPCNKQPGCDCNYCKRHSGNKAIIRPPRSWCYVEQLRE